MNLFRHQDILKRDTTVASREAHAVNTQSTTNQCSEEDSDEWFASKFLVLIMIYKEKRERKLFIQKQK